MRGANRNGAAVRQNLNYNPYPLPTGSGRSTALRHLDLQVALQQERRHVVE